MTSVSLSFFFFFFNDTATTEIYTLSLHDALPIFAVLTGVDALARHQGIDERKPRARDARSEEHTSELQSRQYLVCRLLLEKKKNQYPSANFTELFTAIVSGTGNRESSNTGVTRVR